MPQPVSAWHCGRGDLIARRYRVVEEAGHGNFARVLKAVDTQHPDGVHVAVKILKKEYARDAEFELEVLQSVRKHDPDRRYRVCWMQEHIEWEGHPCFVFRLHGPTLKSRRFGPGHAAAPEIARLARQLSMALRFLHFKCAMVHTDLKPENILLEDGRSRGIGRDWIVCDLGSASFFGPNPDQDLISTRPYRSPEIISGSAWSYAADTWSFGCILYEVATGKKLFDANADAAHLRQMSQRIGLPPPQWLGRNAGPRQKDPRAGLFDRDYRPRQPCDIGDPDGPQTVKKELDRERELADLILQCILFDPAGRMTMDEVPYHPFCRKFPPTADDPDPEPLITRLPSSGYSSGAIPTPCGEQARKREPLSREERERLCGVSLLPLTPPEEMLPAAPMRPVPSASSSSRTGSRWAEDASRRSGSARRGGPTGATAHTAVVRVGPASAQRRKSAVSAQAVAAAEEQLARAREQHKARRVTGGPPSLSR